MSTAGRQQLEFWFSEPNLRRDAFLRKKVEEAADGLVPISLVASFKSIKRLRGTQSSEAFIRACANASAKLRLSADGTLIGPLAPLPLQFRTDADDCTVYAEGYPSTWMQHELCSLFETIASVAYVEMPKRTSGAYAFVELGSVDDAIAVCAALDGRPAEAEAHNTMRVMMKKQWRALHDKHAGECCASQRVPAASLAAFSGVCVRLDGIGPAARYTQVKDILSGVGKVVHLECPREGWRPPLVSHYPLPIGSAVARFASSAQASAAVTYFSSRVMKLCGGTLTARHLGREEEESYTRHVLANAKGPRARPSSPAGPAADGITGPLASTAQISACDAAAAGTPATAGCSPVPCPGEPAAKKSSTKKRRTVDKLSEDDVVATVDTHVEPVIPKRSRRRP